MGVSEAPRSVEGIEPTQSDDDDGGAQRVPRSRRRHRRRWLIGILCVVAVAAAVIAVLWSRTSAHPVSVDQARQRLHASTTVTQPRHLTLVPTPGVYAYKGSGTDALDKPPKSQAEGPTMPATVTNQPGGCWQFRIDYSSNHWQTWNYCSHDGQLDEMGGTTYQKWDFVVFSNESTSTFDCDSSVTIRAAQKPGDTWKQTCHDAANSSTISAGPYRFVGTETLKIGGRAVRALHYHRDRTMSGGQIGTEHTDAWFDADNGLPLRNVRNIDVKTSTVIGDVHYTENASFDATSLTPTT